MQSYQNYQLQSNTPFAVVATSTQPNGPKLIRRLDRLTKHYTRVVKPSGDGQYLWCQDIAITEAIDAISKGEFIPLEKNSLHHRMRELWGVSRRYYFSNVDRFKQRLSELTLYPGKIVLDITSISDSYQIFQQSYHTTIGLLRLGFVQLWNAECLATDSNGRRMIDSHDLYELLLQYPEFATEADLQRFPTSWIADFMVCTDYPVPVKLLAKLTYDERVFVDRLRPSAFLDMQFRCSLKVT